MGETRMPEKSSTYRAVIFDLDGTLLDSLRGIGDAMNRLLEKLGCPVHPLDDYRYFVGRGIEELVRRALPAGFGTKNDFARLVKEYRSLYGRMWRENTRPYQGVSELLDLLTEKGIGMSILSNKSHPFTGEIVRELLGNRHFDFVWGAREGVPLKPHPLSALEISHSLGIPPEQFLLVGDSKIDMQTAGNAGMIPVGVLWGFRDATELLENGARHLVAHPLDLVKILL